MLTKWAKSLLLEQIQDYILPAVEANYVNNAIVAAKSVLNEDVYINAFSYSHGYGIKIEAASNTDGVWIGSGDTPATENDYFLETPITSGCTGNVAKQSIYDATTNSITVRLLVTITNTGSSDLVIKEIGKSCTFNTANTKGGTPNNSARKGIMVDRTVLDSPVTIPASESGVIHYDFIYYTETNNRTTKAKGA